MRIFGTIFNKIKFLIITVVDLLRYICCLRKNGRKSSANYVPLTSVGVVPADRRLQISNDDDVRSVVLNGASDQPPNIQNYIKEYREQKYKQMTAEPVQEVTTDYFLDMTPEIVQQQKVFVNQNEDHVCQSTVSSRLSFAAGTTSIVTKSNELANWEEMEDAGSWDVDELNTDQILKEDRQLERQRRITEKSRLDIARAIERQRRMLEKKRIDKERAPFGSKIS